MHNIYRERGGAGVQMGEGGGGGCHMGRGRVHKGKSGSTVSCETNA